MQCCLTWFSRHPEHDSMTHLNIFMFFWVAKVKENRENINSKYMFVNAISNPTEISGIDIHSIQYCQLSVMYDKTQSILQVFLLFSNSIHIILWTWPLNEIFVESKGVTDFGHLRMHGNLLSKSTKLRALCFLKLFLLVLMVGSENSRGHVWGQSFVLHELYSSRIFAKPFRDGSTLQCTGYQLTQHTWKSKINTWGRQKLWE